MAAITINVPAGITNRVLDAFASQYGRPVNVPDPANPGSTIPNPETKAAFAQRKVKEYIVDVLKAYEASAAGETARLAALNQAAGDATVIT